MKHDLKLLPPKEELETMTILKQLVNTNRVLAELKRIRKNYAKSTHLN